MKVQSPFFLVIKQVLFHCIAFMSVLYLAPQNWDGSGGNGAAVRHYEATGKKYPLAVKLGTITPHSADVFSYAEDDMVTDPKLVNSLASQQGNLIWMQAQGNPCT